MSRSYVREARRRVGPKQVRIGAIIERLAIAHPDVPTFVPSRNDLDLLVAVILSAKTTDVSVRRVTRRLFEKYRRPEDYLAVTQDELERDIHPLGLFHRKAVNLRGAMKTLLEEWDGELPIDVNDLMRLPGVGRKTANNIASDRGVVQGIVVDTHVRRLTQRLGFTRREDAHKIERDLRHLVPRGDWARFSHLLISHGRSVCLARAPRCGECDVSDLCPSRRV